MAVNNDFIIKWIFDGADEQRVVYKVYFPQ